MSLKASFHKLPSTRVLLYGDYSRFDFAPVPTLGALRNDPTEFGVAILKNLLESSRFPRIQVDVVNRFWTLGADGSTANGTRRPMPERITTALLSQYDQIWIMGQHLGSFNPGDPFELDVDGNGFPESALSQAEVIDLWKWMNKGGGVLITGDHSNFPSLPTDTSGLLNLGRALGKRVLRAGKMRVWEGPPGAFRASKSVNTSNDEDSMRLMPNQEDATPQVIYPVSWEIANKWTIRRFFHPLFIGSNSTGLIREFPDHGHEGALSIPDQLDNDEWPSKGSHQPKPVIVAYGTNRNDDSRIAIVSVYDGQTANVGRIVAHTTWHHFVNVNLVGFARMGPSSSALVGLSEYYSNLAWYLTPKAQRMRTLTSMLVALVSTSNIRDLHKAPVELLGEASLKHLDDIATRGQIEDIIALAVGEAVPLALERGGHSYTLPPMHLLIGGIVAECQRVGVSNSIDEERGYSDLSAILGNGVRNALHTRLAQLRAETEELDATLRASDPRNGQSISN